jgi:bifunctional DNA-binding transcriptional regulator/antitoxin component of YhaV-PrlF toxin-antitoxin module
MERSYFLTLQSRGVLTLPSDVRRRHHLDEPGAHVELVEREDGVLELRPRLSVPADQAWFWSERWQTMEREVDEHVRRGETSVYEDAGDLLRHLDAVRHSG